MASHTAGRAHHVNELAYRAHNGDIDELIHRTDNGDPPSAYQLTDLLAGQGRVGTTLSSSNVAPTQSPRHLMQCLATCHWA
jgi:hypothetical protein